MTGTLSERLYETSHPWLTFRLDLRRAGPGLWLLLGEAQSKVQHLSGALLRPEVAQRLHTVYLAKGVHATTAIEGNALTEEQAQQLIEGTLRLPESQEYLAKEIDNILAAFNAISEDLFAGGPRDLSPEMIFRFNRQVLEGLELEEGVVPGELRTHSVVVGGYRGAPAEDLEYLVSLFCDWLNGPDFKVAEPWSLPYAILKAIAAHLFFAWIHPFGDGNGRTARLIELQILLAAGVPTPATHLLSNHYNLTRTEYQRSLDQASKLDDGQLRFINYAVGGFVDGLREQLGMVREQQFDDRWEQYVYEQFGEATSAAQMRRRQLVLDISKAKRPILRSEMRELTPSLALAYAGKTTKTLTRDLNVIRKEMDLLGMTTFRDERQRLRVGFVPRRKLIEAFLPISAADDSSSDN